MANYNDLITAIDSVIKTNNRREITGQLLQNVLNTMVGSLGENYQLAGFATPTTNPHQPDQNVFYVASQAGVYTQFDNIVLGDGISFLMWKNGAWTSQTISIVTQSWVQQNFVSKEWFRKVFRVYDENGLEIVPNDMDSVVDNIKAMVGLWTNEYLSALGMGRDGGGTVQTLAQLNDVQLGTLENGDALVYNTAIHKWENKQIQTGVDMSVVWAALAANTNEQINASHLATALSSYVTSANLSTMLNDYATKAWAGQNFITVEWFDKLFQLYNGTEAEANKIAPNGALPIDQTQLNIEAMFGFWTKKYISALGQGDDGTAGTGDVTWALLATQATDGRTIHLSYISAALASYLSANNYLQSSAIADMATQTWVGQQGFLTSSSLSNYYTKTEVDALPRIKAIALGSDGCLSFTWQDNTSTIADYSHEHSWFELLDRPDTLAGFGVTLTANDIPSIPKSKISDFPTSWAWSAITGKPTTVSGYGITDAITTANIGSQSVNYATSAGSVSWGNVGNKPSAAGNGTTPVYWTGSGFTACTPYSSASVNYANSAGNADTLDGYHYSSFLLVSGGDMKSGARISFSGGNGYLGNANNAGWLMVQDMCSQNSAGDGVWSIRTNGNAIFQNVTSYGSVSALSDIRHKEIVRNTNLQVEQIAAMRSVIYRKKDSNDNTLYAGSIAQDWQSILPQVVSVADNDEHTQSLQYGVAALIAIITTARKVAEHERRIADLERENERLKEIINNLNVA